MKWSIKKKGKSVGFLDNLTRGMVSLQVRAEEAHLMTVILREYLEELGFDVSTIISSNHMDSVYKLRNKEYRERQYKKNKENIQKARAK